MTIDPNGIVLQPDVAKGTPCCTFELSQPPPESGWWKVECAVCGIGIILEASGVNDPVAIIVPCRMKASLN